MHWFEFTRNIHPKTKQGDAGGTRINDNTHTHETGVWPFQPALSETIQLCALAPPPLVIAFDRLAL